MRKTQLALAAVALVASSAALADVTVYGNVDVVAGHGDAGTFVGTAGNYQQSRLGFRGVEDLGGGLKADFNLESGIGNTGGIGGGGIGSSFFNRAANVGVSTDMFGLRAGTQISTFIAAQLTGVTGVGGDGAAVPGLYIVNGGNLGQHSATASGLSDLGETTSISVANGGFFVSNAVTASANFAGLTVSAQTRALGSGADKYMAASVSGSIAGINFAIAHQDTTNFWGITTTTGGATSVDEGVNNKQRNTSIGANTELGPVRVNALWSDNKTTFSDGTGNLAGLEGLEGHSNRGYLIGASMPLVGALSGGITYARNSSSTAYGNVEIARAGAGATADVLAMANRMYSATLKYDLSKSAWLYGSYTSFNAATGLPDNAGVTGATKSLYSVGMVKAF